MTKLNYVDFCLQVHEAASTISCYRRLESNTFQRNVGKHLPNDAVAHRRRPEYPVASMRKTPDSQLMYGNPNQQRRDNATK